MKLSKAPWIASLLTAGALLINPSRAERLSGTIDHVNTFQPLESQVVQVEGLNSDVTDANGYYEITPNSVDPSYRFPSLGITEGRIYDPSGRQAARLNRNDIESRLLPSNVNLPIGKYFIRLDNGLTVPHVVLEQSSKALPDILEIPERNSEGSKNRAGTNAIRNLIITGDEYHVLQRPIDISDDTEYSPFMIPVQAREDSTWVYHTGLDAYIAIASGSFRRPSDLPLDIYRTQSLQDVQDSTGTDWMQAIQSAISDAENNGELNWFNNELTYVNADQVQEIEKGVIIIFTNSPTGGGHAYTNTLARYEDGTPYLWEVELNPWLSQLGANAVFRREIGRVMGLDDVVPQDAPGYVMRREAGGWSTFHQQERQAIKLLYNINQRCETAQEKRNLDIWNRYR